MIAKDLNARILFIEDTNIFHVEQDEKSLTFFIVFQIKAKFN